MVVGIFLLLFMFWTAFAAVQRAEYEPHASFWQRWQNAIILGPVLMAPAVDDRGELVGPMGRQGPRGEKGEPGQDATGGVAGPTGSQGPAGADGEDGCVGGTCVDLQGTTPGTQETGHLNISGTGRFSDVIATTLQGAGSSITNLNAGNIATGTLNDARLSTNVALLDRNNQTFTGNQIVFQNSADATNAFAIQNAGGTSVFSLDTTNQRVGIGTTSPDSKLDIQGTSSDYVYLVAGNTQPADATFANSQYAIWLDETSNEFEFKAKKSDGTTFTGTLGAGGGVTGTGTAGQVSFWTGATSQSGNNNFFWDNTNARLGIGTTTPDAKLDIEGTNGTELIRLSNSTTGDSTGIFSGSGSPEGVVTAQIGSVYTDTTNGRIYRKASGDGTNTGWEELTSGGGSAHMAKMTRNAAQTLSSAVTTKIAFDAEEFDVGDIGDFTTNDRFNIKKAGKYLVTSSLYLFGMDDGEILQVYIYKNGSPVKSNFIYSPRVDLDSSFETTDIFDLAVGDFIEMYVVHNEGGNLSTATDAHYKPRMSVIQLDGSGGETSPQYARAFHNAAQSIAHNTNTILSLNSEREDTNNIHDNATNNSRLTAQEAGMYNIACSVAWAANSTGVRDLRIKLNGTTYLVQDQKTTTVFTFYQQVSTLYKLNKNDYVQCEVSQNSGGALNVNNEGNTSPEFSMVKADGGKLSDLQTAYNLGNTITLTDARDFTITAADTATDPNVIFNLQGANTWKIQNTGTDVFTVANNTGTTAAFLFQPKTDSTAALQVKNAAGTSVLNVDTTNQYVGIGTTTPDDKLDIELSDATLYSANMGSALPKANGLILTNLDNTDNAYTGIRLQVGTSGSTTGFIGMVGQAGSTGKMVFGIRAETGGAGGNILERIAIDDDGNVGITIPQNINSEALCHFGNDAQTTVVNITSCSGAPAADYAEIYPTASDVDYGDIVVIGSSLKQIKKEDGQGRIIEGEYESIRELVKSSNSYRNTIIGVASNNWGDFSSIGHDRVDEADNPKPIALNGRVPVKVSAENGAIVAGDLITTSSTPGVGMKATGAGRVIGVAMDNYSGSGTGTVMVFVNPHWYQPNPNQTLQATNDFTDLNVGGLATIKELTVTDKITTVNLYVSGHIFVGKDSGGEVTVPAGATEKAYTFDTIYAKLPLVTVTPNQDPGTRYWVTRTKSGFTIHLAEPAVSNITFSYHTLAPR